MAEGTSELGTTTTVALDLQMADQPAVSYALWHNDIRLLWGLRVELTSGPDLPEVQVSIRSEPEFCEPWTVGVDQLFADIPRELPPPALRLNHSFLRDLNERMRGELIVEARVGDEVVGSQVREIALLPGDQWTGVFTVPESLAAFVTPNAPRIDAVLREAGQILETHTGVSALISYQGEDSDRVSATVAAIYGALQARGITYSTIAASYEDVGQKIRLPQDVLEQGLGNCLDLAVLAAAVLEQAALNPILYITRTHAFVGCWLLDTTFPEAVVWEASQLRKRASLGQVVFFEATALTDRNISFAAASRIAQRQLDDRRDFILAVDVHRTRLSGLRPLPSGGTGEVIADAPVDAHAAAMPHELIKPWTPTAQTPAEKVTGGARPDRWKQRLLDFSLNNRLLNFRLTAKSIRLEAPDLAALEDALASGRKLQVHGPPQEFSRSRLAAARDRALRTGNDLADELLKSELQAGRLRVLLDEATLQRNLVGISRDARLSLDENGANTLFLALGFLVWLVPMQNRACVAPLLLMPVTIQRRSRHERFELRAGNDETVFNSTLLEFLTKEHKLTLEGLDPLPTDENGVDIHEVMNIVTHAVSGVPHWEVIQAACLGLFSFTKFLMWRDLDVRADDLRRNAVVQHLIDTPTAAFRDPAVLTAEPSGNGPAYLPVVSVDSSQLKAVEAAVRGHSYVLHGPPGTGKSQTITSLIANALYAGKTVLFVAEKAAALNVVHSRLERLGLGPFTLALHSNKAQKASVLADLAATLNLQRSRAGTDWKECANHYKELRAQLEGYHDALHRRQAPGHSMHDALSTIAQLREMPAYDLGWPPTTLPPPETLARCRRLAADLRTAAQGVEHLDGGPWAGLPERSYSLAWREAVRQRLGDLRAALDTFQQAREAVRSLAPVLDLQGPRRSRTVADVLVSLLQIDRTLARFGLSDDWPTAQPHLAALVESGRRSADEQGRLQDTYGAAALAELPDITGAECQAIPQLAHLVEAAWTSPETIRDVLDRTAQATEALATHAASWATARGAAVPTGWAASSALGALADLVSRAPAGAAILVAPDAPLAAAREAVDAVRDLTTHTDELTARYGTAVLDLDAVALHAELVQAQAAFFLVRGRKVAQVLAPLVALDTLTQAPATDERADHLSALAGLQRRRHEIDRLSNDGTRLLGDRWAGAATDLGAAESTLAWADDFHDQLVASATSNLAIVVTNALAVQHDPAEAARRADLHAAAQQAETARADLARVWPTSLPDDHTTALTLVADARQAVEAAAVLCAAGGGPESAATLSTDLPAALDAGAHLRAVASTAAEPWLGALWQGAATEWSALQTALDALASLRKTAHTLLGEGAAEAVAPFLETAQAAGAAPRVQALLQGAVALDDAVTALAAELGTEASWLAEPSDDDAYLDRLAARSAALTDSLGDVQGWLDWRQARGAAAQGGLSALLAPIEQGELPADEVADSFEHSYARWFTQFVVDAEPALLRFRRATFEHTLAEFAKADKQVMDAAQAHLIAKLAKEVPQVGTYVNDNSEVGILLRQTQRQRGHLPLRSLFAQIPRLLGKLKPVLLMSPLSVAQYLDPKHPPFDLVVFDEASQIPVWDAIGAMARGSSVVIVGDPRQLPPTSFFERAEADDEPADDEEVRDLESILDDCQAAQIGQHHLNWHYRSRHESLITFSNHRYYDRRLVTFPSPDRDSAVSFRFVGGTYDRGGERTNQAEAEAIVTEIEERLADPLRQHQSLGVVTFNMAQQRLIEDLLEMRSGSNSVLDAALDPEREEPLFVKNLENVQGDERDVILFSICFGPDSEGRVAMNFGPLNKAGGARRLNVAVTRSRRETMIFASLRAEDIDLGRVSKEGGVGDLKAYLDFAERGLGALTGGTTSDGTAASEQSIEQALAEALRARGHEVDLAVGSSDYRLDLAVRDPRDPTRHILGIACDGASYRQASSVRDRDLLRRDVLAGLGWRLERVYSLEWWQEPKRVLARLEKAISAALAAPSDAQPAEPEKAPEPVANETPPADDNDVLAADEAAPAHTQTEWPVYRESRPRAPLGTREDFFGPSARAKIATVLSAVVQREGPLSLEAASRRVIQFWDIKSLTKPVRVAVDNALPAAAVDVHRRGERTFLWPAGADPAQYRVFRVNGDAEREKRKAEEIAPEEVANAAAEVLRQQIGLPREDLVTETARLLGYQRVSAPMREYFNEAVEILLATGRAEQIDGADRLHLTG